MAMNAREREGRCRRAVVPASAQGYGPEPGASRTRGPSAVSAVQSRRRGLWCMGDLVTVHSDPSAAVAAINHCDRPDVALQLAFRATDNRKGVIRLASNTLPLLRNEGLVTGLITPYPSEREAVDVYADNGSRISAANSWGRASIFGTVLAFALAYGIHRVEVFGAHAFRPALFVLIPLLTLLVETLFAAIVRRRAARLDDES